MANFYHKFTSVLVLIGVILQLIVQLTFYPTSTKAATTDQPTQPTGGENADISSPDNEGGSPADDFKSGEQVSQLQQMFVKLSDIAKNPLGNTGSDSIGLTFNDLFGSGRTKIVLKQSDYNTIKSLYCISEFVSGYPDYNTNLAQLAKDSGKKEADLKKLRDSTNPNERQDFRDIVRTALINWSNSYDIKSKLQSGGDPKTLACITGMSSTALADLKKNKPKEFNQIIEDSYNENATKIDIRIIKTLVYLVTPKSEGGAEHYRIKVQRIFQKKPYSTESDAVLGNVNQSLNAQTAAEVGQQQRQGADATIEDQQNQTQSDVYFSEQELKNEKPANLLEANFSAHSTGQAMDISEIDDIRCTVIGRKRLHWFGNKDKVTHQPAQPVKLAWQTTEGYKATGGNDAFDVMDMMKQSASESLRDLADSVNGDFSNYEGDLSKSSLGDLATLLGKQLMADAINTPDQFLEGADINETMKNLGTAFMADYLGLPKSSFTDRSINWIDDFTMIIGESSVEKRLNLPIGMLEPTAIKAAGGEKESLKATLENIGKRKIAIEMGLKPNDLLDYKDINDPNSKNIDLVGRRAIERGLNIPLGSFKGSTFDEVQANIGYLKTTVILTDSTYVDKTLHIPIGSTKAIIEKSSGRDGKAALNSYISLVGTTRTNDTIKGFNYLAAHNSAYEIPGDATPAETWQKAIDGNIDALRKIGIFIVMKAIVNDGSDDQRDAIVEWLKTTIGDNDHPPVENCLGQPQIKQEIPKYRNGAVPPAGHENDKITVVINTDKLVSVGLKKSEVCLLFGQTDGNGRGVYQRVGSTQLYYAFLNASLNEKNLLDARVDLSHDPTLQITNQDILFYTTRVERIKNLAKKITQDWANLQKEEALQNDDQLKAALDKLVASTDKLVPSTLSDYQGTGSQAGVVGKNVGDVKAILERKRAELNDLADQINGLIIDVNALYHTTFEVIEGKELPSAFTLTQAQIQSINLGGNSGSSSNGRDSKTVKITPQLVFLFISGKVSPVEFFEQIALQKVESELDLPPNSLSYFAEEMEIRGVGGIEAFYQSIGEAKIEEQLHLPAYYLQGPVYKDLPDFNKIRLAWPIGSPDMKIADKSKTLYEDLTKYYSHSNVRVTNVLGQGVISPNDEAKIANLILHARSPVLSKHKEAAAAWKKMRQAANREFIKEQNAKNQNSDNTMADVAINVGRRGLTDGLRTAKNDIMFRFGLSGSFDNATTRTWSTNPGNMNRGSQIDRDLGIVSYNTNRSSNTEALFTGADISLKDGRDLLTQDEKNLIGAGITMQQPNPDNPGETIDIGISLSENVLNRYLQVLNNETDLNGFKTTPDSGVYYNSLNPYASTSRVDATGECRVTYQGQSGFEVADSIQNDAYVYIDGQGKAHSFKTQDQALAWINSQGASETNYLDLLSSYLFNLAKYLQSRYGDFPTENKIDYKKSFATFESTRDFAKTYLQNQNFDLLPFEFLRSAVAVSNLGPEANLSATSSDPTNDYALTINGIPFELFTKLFGKRVARMHPLQDYRRAVGIAEAQRVLTWTIFRNLGIKINPKDFSPSDLHAILNGDYRPLFRLGTAMINNGLDLPPNTVYAILNVHSLDDVKCTLRDAGAAMLGRMVGLQYVEFSGDPATLLDNMGQAKIEQTMRFKRGSFHGDNLQDVFSGSSRPGLVSNVGYIDFVLAYQIPLAGSVTYFDKFDGTINAAAKNLLSKILPAEAANKYLNSDTRTILQAIKDNIPYSQNPDPDAVYNLSLGLFHRIKELKEITIPTSKFYTDSELKRETNYFISRITMIDTVLSLPTSRENINNSTTFKLLSEQIEPKEYIHRAAIMLLAEITTDKLADVLGLNETTANLIFDTVKNFDKIFNCKSSRNDCDGWAINSGSGRDRLFRGLEQAFSTDLDAKSGLMPGSISAILRNPNSVIDVLMINGADDLDRKYGLDTSTGADYANALGDALFGNLHVEQALDPNAYNAKQGTFKTLYTRYNRWQLNKMNEEDRGASCASDSPASGYRLFLTNSERAELDRLNTYTPGSSNQLTDEDRYTQRRVLIDRGIQKCLNSRRADGPTDGNTGTPNPTRKSRFEEIVNLASTRLANIIKEKTKGTINMPPTDIKHLVFEGNMRYLAVAGTAYLVNVYINNDNPNTPREDLLPQGLLISYDDIRMAFIGDPGAENYAAVAAQYAYLPTVYIETTDPARPYSSVCLEPGDCDPVQTVVRNADNNLTYSARDANAIRNGTNYAVYHNFGLEGVPMSQADMQAAINDYRTQLVKLSNDPTVSDTAEECAPFLGAAVVPTRCEARKELYDLDIRAHEGKEAAKKQLRDSLQFRLMDALLWRTDHNVYPGFAWDLIKGSWSTKYKALGAFILNGIENGKLFGMEFNKIVDAGEWLLATNYIQKIARGEAGALDNFLKDNQIFSFFDNKFTDFIDNALGFKLPSGTVSAILVGISTGHWGGGLLPRGGSGDGLIKYDADGNGYYQGQNGKLNVGTLGTVATKYAMNVVFKWADNWLHVPVGTMYKVYTLYQNVQAASQLATKVRVVGAISNIPSIFGLPSGSEVIEKYGSGPAVQAYKSAQAEIAAKGGSVTFKGVTYTKDQAGALAAAKAKYQVNVAKTELYSFVLTTALNAIFGKDFGNFDKDMNFVPGTTAMLVGLAVESMTTLLLHCFDLTTAVISLATIVIMNLFGIYRYDVYCSADGFYPDGSKAKWNLSTSLALQYGGAPAASFTTPSLSNNPDDISRLTNTPNATGLGIWDGSNNQTHQAKSIAAAQVRARQLIGDLLYMQDSPRFREAIPNQIMTGSQRDVEYWAKAADEKLCKKMGNDYYFDPAQGNCRSGSRTNPGAPTRVGVWKNPQTTAFTHVGF